ncbi:MAG: XRE family transcriptional regulator [Terriglobales bacterium]
MPKTTPFKELTKNWPPERHARIEALKAKYEEDMTLEQIREALDLTQQRMARLMKTTQGNVSRLERRHDMLLSTLRAYIAAMGGSLEVSVRFPDTTVRLKNLGQLFKSGHKTA